MLLHPAWIVALVALVLNDRVFKGSGYLSNLLTGKLSDVAGMLVAPALLALVLRARTRRAAVWCHLAVLAVFAAIKLSRGAADVVEAIASGLGLSWRIWVDPTDLLVAVPALAASVHWLIPAMGRPVAARSSMRRLAEAGAGTLGLVACLGTSSEPPEVPTAPVDYPPAAPMPAVTPRALDLGALQGAWQSGGPGTPTAYRFDGDRYLYTADFASPESGRVELVSATDSVMRLRLVARTLGKEPLPPVELAIALTPDRSAFQVADTRGVGRTFRHGPPPAALAGEATSDP